MKGNGPTGISKFFVAGISYKKTDASVRGAFAISDEQYRSILESAPSFGLNELLILSTCNRTEIYGLAEDVSQLIQLLCSQVAGSSEQFSELAYIKKGTEAIEHLFFVGAGLDSQILGDYEIIGQLKRAAKLSKEQNFIHSFMERLVNAVIQSSKTIKNQTAISGGTVSVSFAAIQCIRKKITDFSNRKILLLGTGKIGRNTCKNMVDYLETHQITLINRSPEKARRLATELNVKYAMIDELQAHIHASDIILVATNASEPTISYTDLVNTGNKLIIDLSIPYNVDPSAATLDNITLVNVDELSKLKDETLQKREAEVPKAKQIIAEHLDAFIEWCEMRKHVPVLKAVKIKLGEIHSSPLFSSPTYTIQPAAGVESEEKIQRVINGMAHKMRRHNQQGCHFIEAIHEFISAGSN